MQAQHVDFDHMHASDGAIFLKSVDGTDVLYNAQGNEIEVHPVFRMGISERKELGVLKSISSQDGITSGRDDHEGPTIHITYLDQVKNTNAGFDHPTLGEQRRNTLEAAFQYYASIIEDAGEAEIEIRESFTANPNSNPFAFSASYYFGSKGFNSPFTAEHILSGNDPYGGFPDAYIQFNFHDNLNYHYGISSQPNNLQFDFYTVVLHEIMHLLGFTSYSNETGASAASENVYTSFDQHLADFNKDELFEVIGSGSNTEVKLPDDGMLTNDQVWFELYAGQHAPVFSPDPFNSSSLDHFDNSRSSHGEYLMHPSLSKGDGFKLLHEDEVRVLEMLGYGVNFSVATSINDHIESDESFQTLSGLYPNPAYRSDRIQIDIGQVEGSEILVIVYDIMGRQSYSKVILNEGSGPITAVDPYNNLAPGMYIVVGSSKDELFNEKLVIK